MSSKIPVNLIIGGSGFVGSALISEIGPDNVLNIDKKISPFFEEQTKIGDITNIKQLDFPDGIQSVVLLAAEHRDDVSPVSCYYDVNVNGTKNVLSAMDKVGVKNLIFTSSVAIYGLNKANPDEIFEPDPFNHYGKSKWEAELVIKEWFDRDPKGKSVTIIRPTVIFGERNRGNVFNLFKQIASRKFFMIGSGKNKKSMAYVGNVVNFINNRLEASATGYNVYNYSDKPDFSMNELVSLIGNNLGVSQPKFKIPFFIGILGGYFFDLIAKIRRKKISISSIRVKKFCATTQFNASKAHSIFDAPFTLQQGLSKTIDHEFINKNNDDVLFYSE